MKSIKKRVWTTAGAFVYLSAVSAGKAPNGLKACSAKDFLLHRGTKDDK